MKKIILLLFLILSFIEIGQAQNFSEIIKAAASDGAADDYFGRSVSISGNYAIIGSYQDDDNGSASGSVYIYKRNRGGTNNWGLLKKITASDGAADDWFGWSVSTSGDYAIVGAYQDDDNGGTSGSAYIYKKNEGGTDNWGQVKKITASDGATDDFFGFSVSISGDYAIVGADGDDDNGSLSGSSYIYQKDEGGTDNWGQVKKITAFDGTVWGGAAYDRFGFSVSISGDYAIIGADGDDDDGSSSGSAYIYQKDEGGTDNWGQVKKITASDGAESDFFGLSVSISGDYAIIGAYGDDDNGSWSGSSYIYQKDEGGTDNWGQVKKITASDGATDDYFGLSVSISGDYAIVGAYGDDDNGSLSGSAYIYQKDEGGTDNWGQVKKITASDGAASDDFGRSVSISGDNAIVGAFQDDDDGSSSGSAYSYQKDEGGTDNWGQVKKITASDGAESDYFGVSVSISGDYAIAGAYLDDDNGSSSGSAYIYQKDEGGTDNWGQVKKITASDGAASDYFGRSVSISGDYAIVGADGDGDNGSGSGSAYIYQKDEGGTDNWGQVKKITASDGAGSDYFGFSVSISGDYAIIGAYGGDDNGSLSGSAYIYQKDEGGTDNWGQVKKITASDGAADDYFGRSVSISGDNAIVGAHGDDDNGSLSGSAYIYKKDEGGADNWGQVKKITASDGAAYDVFGRSVSISGDYAIVGAHVDDDNGSYSGSAYIYQKDEGSVDNWGQVKKITASDGATNDYFGVSVSISGDYAIVGAYRDDDNGSSSGSAYIYQKDEGSVDNWGQVKKITASDGAADDYFGVSVSISGDYAIVGAYLDDDNGSASGSAYIYKSSAALPVELSYFKGTNIAEGSLLTWQTAIEENNKGFEIERSKDGKNWENIGFVQGNGTTLITQNYTYIDEAPFVGINYYRLKQIDLPTGQADYDGAFEYSDIVTVEFRTTNATLAIYPNPVTNELNIIDGQGRAIIYNLLGQPVRELIISNEQLIINTSDLAKGQYILSIQRKTGEIITKRFIK